MTKPFSGVRAYARRAWTPAAVAGLAGLALAPQAQAEDAPHEVAGVRVEGHLAAEPVSPKFTADLLDTPRSVTVIPQIVIEQTAATSLQDILRTSPGITFGAGEGGQPLADRPFIRGQASGNNVFVDGVRDSGGQVRDIFNLEQVEVVKGPDSAYNGRGSGGGSINLTSKQPKLVEATSASLRVGTDSYVRASVDANYVLGDTSAVRVNLMAAQGDVPQRDAVDFDTWGAAVAAALGLGTDSRLTLSYQHLTRNDMPDYGVPLSRKLPGVTATETGILDVPRDAFYGLTARDFQETTADIATLVGEHDINAAMTFRGVFRYAKTVNDYVVTNPGDGGNAQFVDGQWWMKRGLKSRWNPATTVAAVADVYGRFTTGAIEHSYDIGLELSREKNENASYTVTTTAGSACPAGFTGAGTGDCTLVYAPNPSDPWAGTIVRGPVSSTVSKTVGIYVFDTLSFGDRWKLNLGLRHDEYSVSGRNVTTTAVTASEGDWSFTNYQAGLVYKPTAHGSLYLSYGTASTPPTISGGDQNTSAGVGSGNLANQLLDPEETTSTEIGVKWAFFGERLSTSAALFQVNRQNAQILVDVGVYAQAGETEVRGLELAVTGQVTPAWSVFGGYTYMESELVRGAYNNVNVGDPLANTPEHSFSLFSTYQLTPALSLGGGAYYVSDSFGGNQGGAGGGANGVYAPEYWRFDAFASYRINDRLNLQLNVQNVTDEDYIARTNGVHHADYGPARQALLTLNAKF
ncbi:MAG: TonB-dependent siderophore receptor [Phenylobacterium sp.]|uniref:TonB-dependent receptor n=1 Tax=Phenylobacterium sp. TaxID=1871053 RepID=UPI002733EBCA|nr:TonB-dependent siderophore receptor [Phenylobacterium sp.]MDP1643581.1 TonB-dependent siderophore receptor [Phenylobacterium sp.]MDP3118701.1 TonB-dependent siderophore receptor [Phenylobacterium sp.]